MLQQQPGSTVNMQQLAQVFSNVSKESCKDKSSSRFLKSTAQAAVTETPVVGLDGSAKYSELNWMDITRENFIEKLPLVLKTIRSADFIAYDTEFSGLKIGFEDRSHDFETVESMYQKKKHAVTRLHAF